MHRTILVRGAAAALATTLSLTAGAPADPLKPGPTVRHQMRIAGDHAALVRQVGRLEHRLGRHPHRLARLTRPQLRSRLRADRRALAQRDAQRRAYASVAVPGALQAIAACESGGNPQAIGGGGAFRGKYQFTYATWAAVGGSGDPAAAPEAEQDMRAALLYARAGAGQWPVCGR